MKTGIELIAIERQEQIEKHGWDNDVEYNEAGDLIQAALFCLTQRRIHYPDNWSEWFFEKIWAKRNRMNGTQFDIERFKIAGALIAAEIDRIQAIEKPQGE